MLVLSIRLIPPADNIPNIGEDQGGELEILGVTTTIGITQSHLVVCSIRDCTTTKKRGRGTQTIRMSNKDKVIHSQYKDQDNRARQTGL